MTGLRLILPRRPPDGSFEAFWVAYPRRPANPKAAARVVWDRLVIKEGIAPAEIVEAARRYAREVAALATPPAFVPHARTWLHQRRFEDYLERAQGGAEDATAQREHPLARALPGMSRVELETWLDPVTIERDGAVATITCPSRFHADTLRGRFGGDLAKALQARLVRYRVKGET